MVFNGSVRLALVGPGPWSSPYNVQAAGRLQSMHAMDFSTQGSRGYILDEQKSMQMGEEESESGNVKETYGQKAFAEMKALLERCVSSSCTAGKCPITFQGS